MADHDFEIPVTTFTNLGLACAILHLGDDERAQISAYARCMTYVAAVDVVLAAVKAAAPHIWVSKWFGDPSDWTLLADEGDDDEEDDD